MKLFYRILLCLTSYCALHEGKNAQSENEEHFRTLIQPQPMQQGSVEQPVFDNMQSYLSWRPHSSQYLPSSIAANGYAEAMASTNNGKIAHQPWSGLMPQGFGNGAASAFASSSVHVKKPDTADIEETDIREMAYSSVKDVDAEEQLGANQVQAGNSFTELSDNEESKKSPETIQHKATVPEPMARKSNTFTPSQQNTIPINAEKNFSDVYFVAIVAGCSAAGIFGIISAGICFYRLQKNNKASADVDYPAYGVTGPSKDSESPNGDRKLAQSAQMYHYQHQKQQMIAVEKAGSTKHTSASDVDSEEENEEGDYTVYECPGLASTGEMEVKNPLFNDDSTPMSPAVLPTKLESIESK